MPNNLWAGIQRSAIIPIKRGHEDRDDPLNGVEEADMRPQTGRSQEAGHRGEVRPPDGELEEIHHDKAKLYGHDYVGFYVFFDY